MVLERRGYIQRRPGDDGLFLSNRLHDLSNRYPPLRRMLDVALPIMNSASVEAYQAMHVAVLDHLDIRVVAQVDSPAPLGFRLQGRDAEPGGRHRLRPAADRLPAPDRSRSWASVRSSGHDARREMSQGINTGSRRSTGAATR
jgi:hypothetical protein